MGYEYIRGIMRPDGTICIEYHATGEEEPGQIDMEDNLSDKTDSEIRTIFRERYPLANDVDYSSIPIDRSWYEHTQAKRQQA